MKYLNIFFGPFGTDIALICGRYVQPGMQGQLCAKARFERNLLALVPSGVSDHRDDESVSGDKR